MNISKIPTTQLITDYKTVESLEEQYFSLSTKYNSKHGTEETLTGILLELGKRQLETIQRPPKNLTIDTEGLRLQIGMIKLTKLQKQNGRTLYNAIKENSRLRLCSKCNGKCYHVRWYCTLEDIIIALKPKKVSPYIIRLYRIQEALQTQKVSIKDRQSLIKKLRRQNNVAC